MDDFIQEMYSNVHTWKEDINEFMNIVHEGANLTQYYMNEARDISDEYSDEFQVWLDIANIIMLCLYSVLLAGLFLLLLGLFGGVFGYSKVDSPEERSTLSHYGGNCLMVAVGFMFVFAFLLMLICVVMLAVGAPAECWGCQELEDESLTYMTELIDKPRWGNWTGEEYLMGEAVWNDPTVSLNLSDLLILCRNDEPLWNAVAADLVINETGIYDYVDSFDVDGMIKDAVDSVMSSLLPNTELIELVTLTDNTLETLIVMDMSLSDAADELNQEVSPVDMDMLYSEINATYDSVITVLEAGNATNSTMDEITSLFDSLLSQTFAAEGILVAAELEKDNLSSRISDIMAVELTTTNNNVATLLASLNEVEEYMNNSDGLRADLQQNGEDYGNRMLSYFDNYLHYALTILQTQIGKCGPVWTAYADVVVLVCDYTLNPVNAYWFCLGWVAILFIPTIIVAVVLAPSYYRLKNEDEGTMYRMNPKQTDEPQIIAHTVSQSKKEPSSLEERDHAASAGPPDYPPYYHHPNEPFDKPRDAGLHSELDGSSERQPTVVLSPNGPPSPPITNELHQRERTLPPAAFSYTAPATADILDSRYRDVPEFEEPSPDYQGEKKKVPFGGVKIYPFNADDVIKL